MPHSTAGARYPSLDGRSVFITGGATGIGAALVTAFAEQGARVGFVDIDDKNGSALAAAVGATFENVDVTDDAALRASIDAFAAGGLDVLINNVANDTRHDARTIDASEWRRCLAVNLDAAFFASQAAIPHLKAAGGGSVVNFSSITALLGPPEMPGYVAAKSALLGLTKSLAHDFGADGVRVNAILPGWIATQRQLDLWFTPGAEADWTKHLALKRRILPDEVARLALFLASDDSRAITGQYFVIDGGRT